MAGIFFSVAEHDQDPGDALVFGISRELPAGARTASNIAVPPWLVSCSAAGPS